MVKINQMKKDELFEGFYLIKSADVRQTRAGKNYLAFVFQDDTGTIEGKLWDAQPHNVDQFQAGRPYDWSTGSLQQYSPGEPIDLAFASKWRTEKSSRL